MEVCFDEAVKCFERLPPDLRLPGLSPHYVAMDASRDAACEPIYFTYEAGGELFYQAGHRTPVPGTSALFDLQAPYGYGGPAATTEAPDFLAEAHAAHAAWCRERAIIAEFIRFHPLARNERFFAGEARLNRETVVVDLDQGFTDRYETRVRTAIRKAERELRLEILPDCARIDEFAAIYREGMRLIGADAFYLFPQDYFDACRALPGLFMTFAFRDSELVAGALFLRGAEMVEYHLSASNEAGKKLSASNLMIHGAARHAQATGARHLHLGGGTDPSRDNRLLFFKAGFSPTRALFKIGGQVFDRQAYDALRADWSKSRGDPGGRVLFYR